MNAFNGSRVEKFLSPKTLVVPFISFLAFFLLPISGPLYVEAALKTTPTYMKGRTVTWTLDPGVIVSLQESACGSVRGSLGFKVTSHNFTAGASPDVRLDRSH